MKIHRSIVLCSTAFLLALIAGVPACSKSTKPKELNSGTIAPGGTFAHTFNAEGTYHYCCDIHGCTVMNANVIVAPSNPTTAGVTITNNSFSGDVTVAPGGTVTWTNNGSNHTVTSH